MIVGGAPPTLHLAPHEAVTPDSRVFNHDVTVPADIFAWVKDKEHLELLVQYILCAPWYQNPGKKETLEPGLLKKLVKKGLMKEDDSPFRPFFSEDGNHYCHICLHDPAIKKRIARRPLDLAIGHARKHFNHTFHGKFTNPITKKEMERRKSTDDGKYLCPIWYELALRVRLID